MQTTVNEYDCYAKWLPDESLLLGHSFSVTMVSRQQRPGEGQEEQEEEEQEEEQAGLGDAEAEEAGDQRVRWRVRHTFRRVYIGPGPGVSPAEPLVLSGAPTTLTRPALSASPLTPSS